MSLKRLFITFALVVLCSGFFIPSSRADYDFNYFHDQLAPYGNWVDRPNYGWVWTPALVPVYWKPYTTGQWEMTNDGMMWVADEPWGWITFHYGRWSYDADFGWYWVPGYVWAPAWVAWREGAGLTGWAPLPPVFMWEVGFGFRQGDFIFDDIDDFFWVFVPERELMEREIGERAEHRAKVREEKFMTKNITNIVDIEGRPVNRSIGPEALEKWVGHPVKQLKIADMNAPEGDRGIIMDGDNVRVFRPNIARSPAFNPPPSLEGRTGSPQGNARDRERTPVAGNELTRPRTMEENRVQTPNMILQQRPEAGGGQGENRIQAQSDERIILQQRQEAEHRRLQEEQLRSSPAQMPDQNRIDRFYNQQRERNDLEDMHNRENRLMQNRYRGD